MNQQTMYERYKREIYRIGWRLQYRTKKIKKRERPISEYEFASTAFTNSSDDKILIEQYMNKLPNNGKLILQKIYIEGHTEVEVARQLNMSQQAVNKWKLKMIQQLSKIVNS
ncbi:sigma-70 family RNA polymerase sigma factor [Cohnella sp. LGH]|uniref:Sigma-70-like protein n=1 Tax=Cohnella phaseoli TaxID=456490 RepID=A0A3D9HQW2_9BACL|nr:MULTISPECIES: sigma factor-like helix-turn-helix DNA-binding protein [Cohnella]QTH40918.1 sigma-70 family RNA polymerase sigma factor [Cohnella sp. LGH]RED51872.1 sigma-70-like protein [Cohnella phaseoli]